MCFVRLAFTCLQWTSFGLDNTTTLAIVVAPLQLNGEVGDPIAIVSGISGTWNDYQGLTLASSFLPGAYWVGVMVTGGKGRSPDGSMAYGTTTINVTNSGDPYASFGQLQFTAPTANATVQTGTNVTVSWTLPVGASAHFDNTTGVRVYLVRDANPSLQTSLMRGPGGNGNNGGADKFELRHPMSSLSFTGVIDQTYFYSFQQQETAHWSILVEVASGPGIGLRYYTPKFYLSAPPGGNGNNGGNGGNGGFPRTMPGPGGETLMMTSVRLLLVPTACAALHARLRLCPRHDSFDLLCACPRRLQIHVANNNMLPPNDGTALPFAQQFNVSFTSSGMDMTSQVHLVAVPLVNGSPSWNTTAFCIPMAVPASSGFIVGAMLPQEVMQWTNNGASPFVLMLVRARIEFGAWQARRAGASAAAAACGRDAVVKPARPTSFVCALAVHSVAGRDVWQGRRRQHDVACSAPVCRLRRYRQRQ